MSHTPTRRSVAKGAAWSIPAVAVASAAPAVAASPCSEIKKGQPLPASAFEATYIADTNETLGGLANKQVALDFGFRVSAAAVTCGVSGTFTSSNAGLTSRFQLSNNTSYNGTNGGSVPANGTAGATDTSCRSGLNGTQACGTSGVSAYAVVGSTGTSSSHVTGVSLVRQVTVPGYGTSTIYLNGSAFGTNPGTNNVATVLSVTSTPLF